MGGPKCNSILQPRVGLADLADACFLFFCFPPVYFDCEALGVGICPKTVLLFSCSFLSLRSSRRNSTRNEHITLLLYKNPLPHQVELHSASTRCSMLSDAALFPCFHCAARCCNERFPRLSPGETVSTMAARHDHLSTVTCHTGVRKSAQSCSK